MKAILKNIQLKTLSQINKEVTVYGFVVLYEKDCET